MADVLGTDKNPERWKIFQSFSDIPVNSPHRVYHIADLSSVPNYGSFLTKPVDDEEEQLLPATFDDKKQNPQPVPPTFALKRRVKIGIIACFCVID